MWNKWKTSLRYNWISSSTSFKNCLCRDHIWTARESVTPNNAAIDGLIYVRCEIHQVWSRTQVRPELIGGSKANHTSAERNTDQMLRSTQTSYRLRKSQCECRTRRRSYASTEGLPRRCLITLRDQSSLPSLHDPSLSFPFLGKITLQSLFIFSSGRSYFIARCQGRVMDKKKKNNEICLKMPHLARDNQTIVS